MRLVSSLEEDRKVGIVVCNTRCASLASKLQGFTHMIDEGATWGKGEISFAHFLFRWQRASESYFQSFEPGALKEDGV